LERFEKSHRILCHPLRRKVLRSLFEKDRTLQELSDICAMDHYGLSHRLREMGDALEYDPAGKVYRLTDKGRSIFEWFLRAPSDYICRLLDLEVGAGLNPIRYAGGLAPGDHALLFYEGEPIRRAIVLSFLRAGLRGNSALIYLAAEGRVDRAAEEISRGLADVDMGEGALEVMSAEEWYVGLGRASADLIVENWSRLAERKIEEGYGGLRIATEADGLLEEAKIDPLAIEEGFGKRLPRAFCALCQYDASKLEPEEVVSLIKSHGHALFEGIALGLARSE
jgi:hypothetical protein